VGKKRESPDDGRDFTGETDAAMRARQFFVALAVIAVLPSIVVGQVIYTEGERLHRAKVSKSVAFIQ